MTRKAPDHNSVRMPWLGINSIIIFGDRKPLDGIYWPRVAVIFYPLAMVYYAVFFIMPGMFKRIGHKKYGIPFTGKKWPGLNCAGPCSMNKSRNNKGVRQLANTAYSPFVFCLHVIT